MPSLPYPGRLTNEEFIRLADAALVTGELSLEWQRNAIERLAGRSTVPFRPISPLPMHKAGAENGRD